MVRPRLLTLTVSEKREIVMGPTRHTLEATAISHVQPRRRSLLARLALAGTLGLTLCLGAAAAGMAPPDSASGGPGTVR